MANSRRKKKEYKGLYRLGWVASVIQIAASAILIALLLLSQFLPLVITIVGAAVLVVLIFVCRQMMKKRIKLGRFWAGFVIALVIAAIVSVGNYYLFQVTSTLRNISGANEETSRVAVYVLEEDPAQTIQDASGYDFGIMKALMRKDTDTAVGMINEELGAEIATVEYERSTELAQALLDQECQAIVLSEDFINLITEAEGFEAFDTQVREIACYEWKTEVSHRQHSDGTPDVDPVAEENPEGVFTMFISGIDTSGPISTKSRSDVNIIAVFNTNTHQVLLVSTPRDYYVPLSISNGVPDKLTHAGIYGIDCSMDTLEMLYGINMDYYFRVNFSGFQEIIDSLGGITVSSEQEFDTGNFHFVEGYNELDGEHALAFARARYAFADGDRQRGRNQMAVITAVIAKMQSPAILSDFTGLMNGLEGSFETNMPYSEISDLVRDQLTDGGAWSVVQTAVDGTGDSQVPFSMSQRAYVMVPDQATVDAAKEKIELIKKGQIVR